MKKGILFSFYFGVLCLIFSNAFAGTKAKVVNLPVKPQIENPYLIDLKAAEFLMPIPSTPHCDRELEDASSEADCITQASKAGCETAQWSAVTEFCYATNCSGGCP